MCANTLERPLVECSPASGNSWNKVFVNFEMSDNASLVLIKSFLSKLPSGPYITKQEKFGGYQEDWSIQA